MSQDPRSASEAEARWEGGWEAHQRRQQDAWARTTPAQRLAWLEEAIRFAHRAGALPRRRDDRDDNA
jgi:hypothetical protein